MKRIPDRQDLFARRCRPQSSGGERHSAALSRCRIDWVVEEPYAPLVGLHSAVRRVIPVAPAPLAAAAPGRSTWREIGEFRRLFRTVRYDAIVDTQGLLKSALIARAAKGRHHD